MNSGTRRYLKIAGFGLYHIAALYCMMLLLNLHTTMASLIALVWVISFPISLWKGSKFATKVVDLPKQTD